MSRKLKTLKTLLIAHILAKGKKQSSEKFITKTLKQLQKYTYKNHSELIILLIIKISPIIQIKQIRRKKRRTKEFPYITNEKKRCSQAIKIITKKNRQKSEETIIHKITKDFINNLKDNNNNKYILHEYAFTTKKFANFRWFV